MRNRMILGLSVRHILSASLGLGMLTTLGCGDETSRMAGTIELPARKTGRPDMDRQAKEAKPQLPPGR